MSGRSNERAMLAELVGANRTVLDCGCGGGDVARLLQANGCEVFGVDAVARHGELSRTACKAVTIGDLENDATLAEVRKLQPSFDCIVCSHVLEHLRDPNRMLQRLLPLLKRDGLLIVGLPNVAQWRMRVELLRGRWEYRNDGILDRTHFRFFTLQSAVAMLTEAGFRVDRVVYPDFTGPTPLHTMVRGALRAVTTPGLFSSSFLFKCTLDSGNGHRA